MSGATLAKVALDIMEFDWTSLAIRDVNDAVQFVKQQLAENLPAYVVENTLSPRDLESLVSSSISAYCHRYIKPPTTERASVVLFPPGKNLHLYRDGRGWSAPYVPCTFFSTIEFTRRMLDDHVRSAYDRAFREILEQRNKRFNF